MNIGNGNNQPYLLLGEAPNQETVGQPDLWLMPDSTGVGHSANRLLAYTGYTLGKYVELFARANVLDYCPPREGRGRAFPLEDARERGGEIIHHVAEHHAGLVVLGKRAAAAFAWRRNDGAHLPWARAGYLHWLLVHAAGIEVPAAIVPHPSGINRWWSDPDNRGRATRFFENLDRRLDG